MKKLIQLMFFCVFISGLNYSQSFVKDGSMMWTMNLGYTGLTSSLSGSGMDGWSANTTVEKLIDNKRIAAGLNIGYFGATDEFFTPDEGGIQRKNKTNHTTVSLMLGLKYWFYGDSPLVPYLGFTVGYHYSTIFLTSASAAGDIQDYTYFNGISFGLPVGINYFVSKQVFFGLNATGVFFDKTPVKNKTNWMVNFGFGIQML